MPDEIDLQIINLLRENSRISVKELSQRVHLSQPAVKKRLDKLEENTIIGYTIIINPALIAKSIYAYILVELKEEYENEETFKTFIQLNDAVLECYRLTGSYQYLIKIGIENMNELNKFLVKLRQLVLIHRTNTISVLSRLK